MQNQNLLLLFRLSKSYHGNTFHQLTIHLNGWERIDVKLTPYREMFQRVKAPLFKAAFAYPKRKCTAHFSIWEGIEKASTFHFPPAFVVVSRGYSIIV